MKKSNASGFTQFGFRSKLSVLSWRGLFYGWLPLYLPELFPTRIRATGQGLCYNSGRILAAVGAIVQGKLVGAYGGSYARAGATVTLVYLVGIVLVWFAPETKNRPLPE